MTISSYIVPGNASEIKALLKSLYSDLSIATHPDHTQFWIKAPQLTQHQIKSILPTLTSRNKQIIYRFHFIELTHNHDFEQGAQLESFADGISFQLSYNKPIVLSPTQFSGTLRQFQSQENARLRAHPSLIVENNKTASLKVGDQIPFITTTSSQQQVSRQIKIFDTGLLLEISPIIQNKSVVRTSLKLRYSHIKAWKQLEFDRYPIMAERETNTYCVLKDGEGIILSGLLQYSQKDNHASIPILNILPFIGHLFEWKSTEYVSTDLIIMMTVSIV